MAAAGFAVKGANAIEIPDWLSTCKTAIEAQAKGATYSYSKMRDFLMESVDGVAEHIRPFLQAVTKRSYSAAMEGLGEEGRKSRSQRVLAQRMRRCKRTVQYDIAQAEAAGLITVERFPGRENFYHLSVKLLIQAGALYTKLKSEPKPAAPPPSPKEVNKVTQKAAYIYACWFSLMNSGKTPEEAEAELRLKFPELGQKKKQQPAGVVNGVVSALQKAIGTLSQEKSISPPRAG